MRQLICQDTLMDEVNLAMRTVAHARELSKAAMEAFEEPRQVVGHPLCFRVQAVLSPLNS